MIPIKNIKLSEPGYIPQMFERETIITFNETPEAAEIFTYNPALIRKLDALTDERPEEVKCKRAETLNGRTHLRTYTVPKKWIKVNPGRVITEEERAMLSERGKANASNLKNHA